VREERSSVTERNFAPGRFGKTNLLLAVGGLICVTLIAACSDSKTAVADGPTLLKTRCASCHSPERGLMTNKTRAEWEQTVDKMIEKGVKVSGAEKTVLVEYLAASTRNSRVGFVRQ
jgi:mono/diheme cytochrome c family protein